MDKEEPLENLTIRLKILPHLKTRERITKGLTKLLARMQFHEITTTAAEIWGLAADDWRSPWGGEHAL